LPGESVPASRLASRFGIAGRRRYHAMNSRAVLRPPLGGSMLSNTVTVVVLLLIALLYMLPTLIAFGREHPRRQDIAVINILLGWTLIVWIVVFLWASLTRVEREFA
jgi:hypothetical protein